MSEICILPVLFKERKKEKENVVEKVIYKLEGKPRRKWLQLYKV